MSGTLYLACLWFHASGKPRENLIACAFCSRVLNCAMLKKAQSQSGNVKFRSNVVNAGRNGGGATRGPAASMHAKFSTFLLGTLVAYMTRHFPPRATPPGDGCPGEVL